MEKPIVKDKAFLAQKSQPATFMDIAVAQDLLDTLAAHADRCVGLAANMIGVQKCVIAVNIGPTNIAMLNPEIIKRSGKYMTRRAVCRWRASVLQCATKKLRWLIRTCSLKSASRASVALRRRLSSMRLIIAMVL